LYLIIKYYLFNLILLIIIILFLKINKEIYNKSIDVENLKESLKNELQKQFGIEFGVTATWLNCGYPLINPLEKVLFFKKPLYNNTSVVFDDTQFQNVYPMNE